MAFVAQNPSYPDMDTVTLDLGTDYAGETVRLRFRIGTDQAQGAGGWDLDDLAFSGIDNTPFATVADNSGVCNSGGPDAGVGGDAGTGGTQPGGCCQVGGDGQPGSALALAGLVALVGLGRRRRRARR